jgi:hypothetical protein
MIVIKPERFRRKAEERQAGAMIRAIRGKFGLDSSGRMRNAEVRVSAGQYVKAPQKRAAPLGFSCSVLRRVKLGEPPAYATRATSTRLSL